MFVDLGLGVASKVTRKYVLAQSKATLPAMECPVLAVPPWPQHQVVARKSCGWSATEGLWHKVTVWIRRIWRCSAKIHESVIVLVTPYFSFIVKVLLIFINILQYTRGKTWANKIWPAMTIFWKSNEMKFKVIYFRRKNKVWESSQSAVV